MMEGHVYLSESNGIERETKARTWYVKMQKRLGYWDISVSRKSFRENERVRVRMQRERTIVEE
jgi:hypothetical protein